MALKSITLLPGECFILPKDAVVSSVIANGSITASSDCVTLPTPTAYKCGVFRFFVDNTSPQDDTAMEEEFVYYNKLTVGTNSYIINELASSVTDPSQLNIHITNTALFEFKAIAVNTGTSDRRLIAVYFQTPTEFFNGVVLQLSDRGTLYNLPPYAATCDDYPEPE